MSRLFARFSSAVPQVMHGGHECGGAPAPPHFGDEANDPAELREVRLLSIKAMLEEAAGLQVHAAEHVRVAMLRVQQGERAEARAECHNRCVSAKFRPYRGQHIDR